MELQLRLALPNHSPSVGCKSRKDGGCLDGKKNKRSFEEALGKIKDELQMTPLLLWSGQPDEEDDQKGHKNRNSSNVNKNEEEEEEEKLVGWPPIQSWRKKLLHQAAGCRNIENNIMAADHNSKFVKVKMEGVAIARKIDLRLYHSFETLENSLVPMFAKYLKCEQRGLRYTLTYQDNEGDWLLAGDVPWQFFQDFYGVCSATADYKEWRLNRIVRLACLQSFAMGDFTTS